MRVLNNEIGSNEMRLAPFEQKMNLPQTILLLSDQVSALLARYCKREDDVCVGLSGGMDSVVLLHLVSCFRDLIGFRLSSLYVNHGLSPNEKSWARFAVDYSRQLGVPCQVVDVKIPSHRPGGLEAAARRARYQAFEAYGSDLLLLGHHSDDQAETVFFNFLRGSGLAGLCAMPEIRWLSQKTRIVRPLLHIPRSMLLAYAQAKQLAWVEDESNTNLIHTRNFLRHRIFPTLKTIFPGLSNSLCRVAKQVAEANTLLAEIGQQDLQYCLVEGRFDLHIWASFSETRQKNVLRMWLRQFGLQLDARTFAELVRLCHARLDTQPLLIWRDQAIRRYRYQLYLTSHPPLPGLPTDLVWQGEPSLFIPAWSGTLVFKAVKGKGIAQAVLLRKLTLRPRVGGETMQIHLHGPRRMLKKLFQEAAVPPWVRTSMPLLFVDNQLIAVPNYWVDISFLAGTDETGILLEWVPSSDQTVAQPT